MNQNGLRVPFKGEADGIGCLTLVRLISGVQWLSAVPCCLLGRVMTEVKHGSHGKFRFENSKNSPHWDLCQKEE